MAEAADTFEQAFEERRPPEAKAAGRRRSRRCRSPRKLRRNGREANRGKPGCDEIEVTPVSEEEPEFTPEPRPPAQLERLQKILSQAGIASRRHAEELITEGRVQVNGKVVTELGSKADPDRDHIRVDGKLLQGAERLRYFVLNKPRGFVTTVSDPEGRPTVMEFFTKMRERLYPVGRLDYLSEGLLLVTNDGDLANKLTKAATGVEKTYLVKVSGQPTEEELDRLRGGVGIDRGQAGRGPRAHVAGIRPAGPPGRQPLVRSGAHRRPQPRTAQDVRRDRPSRREDSPRGLRPAGAGRRAGQLPRTGSAGTGQASPGRRRQVAQAEAEGSKDQGVSWAGFALGRKPRTGTEIDRRFWRSPAQL